MVALLHGNVPMTHQWPSKHLLQWHDVLRATHGEKVLLHRRRQGFMPRSIINAYGSFNKGILNPLYNQFIENLCWTNFFNFCHATWDPRALQSKLSNSWARGPLDHFEKCDMAHITLKLSYLIPSQKAEIGWPISLLNSPLSFC